MCKYLIEACVESLEQAIKASNNDADRLELCSNLELDGLTPSLELFKSVKNAVNIPIKVMIRPRSGDFEYDEPDIKSIFQNLDLFINQGAKSFVFGAIKNRRLDFNLIQKVANHIYPCKLTIHKAIDTSIDPFEDIEKLKTIANVNAILSSGQKETAISGLNTLKKMKTHCNPSIQLIAAGRITKANINNLHVLLNAEEYHGRNIV